MKAVVTILRILVGALTAFALLKSVVLLLFPFFWPASIASLAYFALCLFGIFALLPKRHCWLSALALHGAAFVFLWFFCPSAERLLYVSGLIVYVVSWWLSVGYASVQLYQERGSGRGQSEKPII